MKFQMFKDDVKWSPRDFNEIIDLTVKSKVNRDAPSTSSPDSMWLSVIRE